MLFSVSHDLKVWIILPHLDVITDHSISVCSRLSVMKPDSCPQFESPEPLLIPVGFEIPISFQGRNLDIYEVRLVRPVIIKSLRFSFKLNISLPLSRSGGFLLGLNWWSSQRRWWHNKAQSSDLKVIRSVKRGAKDAGKLLMYCIYALLYLS